MIHQYLELQQTGQFPKLLMDYLAEKKELSSYYAHFPRLENFRQLIDAKEKFDKSKRQALINVLTQQYEALANPPDFTLLADSKTFTVTTGHQLNIFGGPLYIIYKIVTTINLARLLKIAYPDYNFIPVYWMATEDHDFEEISSVHVFGKTYTWKCESSGAVGALDPRGLVDVAENFPEPIPLFEKAYSQNTTLAAAVRQYMHELFGSAGLVCLDANHPELKKEFLPVLADELEHCQSGELVRNTSAELREMGYDTPVYAREINLFYLIDGLRERIVKEDAEYRVLRTNQKFTREQILEEVHQHPERFSPNVVLRPLYQETVLPNLAYIGGPSEIPYWMQLKSVFDHYQTPFPALIPRNFALYVTAAEQRRLKKLALSCADMFRNPDQLRKQLVARLAEHELHLEDEKMELKQLFDKIVAKAKAVDVTMEAAALAERTRLLKAFSKLERRLHKAEERKHEQILNQLQTVLDSFFPSGIPQERYCNFLDFQLTNRHFLPGLFKCFDPLDFRFVIMHENTSSVS